MAGPTDPEPRTIAVYDEDTGDITAARIEFIGPGTVTIQVVQDNLPGTPARMKGPGDVIDDATP